MNRSCTAPEEGCREGEGRWKSEAQETQLAEARTGGDLSALEQEEWVKVSWKKGECRKEIKLIAEASGLAFDDARIVVRMATTFKGCRHQLGVSHHVPDRAPTQSKLPS